MTRQRLFALTYKERVLQGGSNPYCVSDKSSKDIKIQILVSACLFWYYHKNVGIGISCWICVLVHYRSCIAHNSSSIVSIWDQTMLESMAAFLNLILAHPNFSCILHVCFYYQYLIPEQIWDPFGALLYATWGWATMLLWTP